MFQYWIENRGSNGFACIRDNEKGETHGIATKQETLGFAYECAWNDFMNQFSRIMPDGRRHLIPVDQRPAFRCEERAATR